MSQTDPPNRHVRSSQWPDGPFTQNPDSAPTVVAAAQMIAKIAVEVRVERTRRHWSQKELGKRCGHTQGTISRLEAGSTWSQMQILLEICAALDLTLTVTSGRG